MSLKLKRVNYDIYDDIQTLVEQAGSRTFFRETDLIYKGHIPHAAYMLVNGVMLFKDRSHELPLETGAVIGVREILENLPFRYNVILGEGTEVVILDKSTIFELRENGHLHSIVKDIDL